LLLSSLDLIVELDLLVESSQFLRLDVGVADPLHDEHHFLLLDSVDRSRDGGAFHGSGVGVFGEEELLFADDVARAQ